MRVEFVSFDADRHGEHSLHDFIGMLQKPSIEYEFMAPDGPLMGAYARKQWETAGGRLGGRLGGHQHGEDDEGVHDNKSAVNVRFDGFCAWYRPFIAQCEAKKRVEYRVTSELSGAHFAAPTSYMEARTARRRKEIGARTYPDYERRTVYNE